MTEQSNYFKSINYVLVGVRGRTPANSLTALSFEYKINRHDHNSQLNVSKKIFLND